MAIEIIDLGTVAQDGADGDVAREAFEKVNANFAEHESEIDALVPRLTTVENEVGQLEIQAGQIQGDLTNLTESFNILSSEVGSNTADIQNLENSREYTLVPGEGITIDRTDPTSPVIRSTGSSGGVWGGITGTLSDQVDLQNALDEKVDKVEGKQLSTEDYTSTEKTKLQNIESGAQVNLPTNLSQGLRTENTVVIESSTGTDAVLESATENLSGLMSATDKGELNFLIGKFNGIYHLSDWKIFGAPDYQTPAPNEGAKLQEAFDDVSSVNGAIIGGAKNYLTDRELLVGGNFRSFKILGSGTGNSHTASTAGMTLMTNGLYSAIRAEFNTFNNENFHIEGLNFYNIARGGLTGSALRSLLANTPPAISIVRGANNGSRYVSGFVFRDLGIMGYGAGLNWQGMNTVDAGNNFFGTTVCDNVSMTDVGIGYRIANASLNLLDMRSVLLHNCPFGGILLEHDGAVGTGNGRGSSINVHIGGKSHFEGVGGMFRTQTSRTFGGTGTSEVIRSTITIEGLRHEYCGASIDENTGVPTGDPFAMGVDTDLIIVGDVNYGMGYQEVAYGVIPSSCTVTSSTPTRLNLNGGRSFSVRMINAPTIKRTLANGASTTITLSVPATQVDRPFCLKSQLMLSGGQAGFIESMHRGVPNGAKNTTSVGAPTSGITAAFGAGASGDVISCVISNNSGFAITAELQIENMSSCTILQPSEI